MGGDLIRAVKWSGLVATLLAGVVCSFAVGRQTTAGQTKGDVQMNPRVEHQDGFMMIGIAVRTSNAKEREESQIGKQWARLMGENLLNTIPNKADQNIVAVYTNYASDANGEYTYVLGARVAKAPKDMPAGMVTEQVPPGRYAVFTSERGAVQQVVPATWMRIWKTAKDKPGGDRAYKSDFELYDQRAQNPADAVMEIHVGIR
jgi:predicted transcriptional regulator YdeE